MIDPLRKAGASVQRRGFLEGETHNVLWDRIVKLQEEVDEFIETVLNGHPDPEELSDIIIACSGFGVLMGVDLDKLVVEKCRKDEMTRGYLHNGEGLPAYELQEYQFKDMS